MTLYQIDDRLKAAVARSIDPETGECGNLDEIMQLQMERSEKIESIALFCKNIASYERELKAEKDEIDKRLKQKTRLRERLESILERSLLGCPFETPKCAVTFRKTKVCELDEEHELEIRSWLEAHGFDDCVKYTADVKKEAVKKLLIGGTPVPFAKIEERLSMTVK